MSSESSKGSGLTFRWFGSQNRPFEPVGNPSNPLNGNLRNPRNCLNLWNPHVRCDPPRNSSFSAPGLRSLVIHTI